ncbi:DUF3017 domain-containing protein [Nocardia wallacei]|uniref:DUF3017 domain-containing protein n=1 Tax=Nocardia wallacei TaxID=480035 RepID=UPI001E5DF3BD|nr:DUF3017 domain-containing protein [Nocardia wallacei]
MTEAPAAPAQHSGPSGRFFRNHLPLLLVVAVLLVAVVFVAQDRWRRGAYVIGGATLLAATLRACLPTARVGLLAVRSKPFDVGAYAVLGGAVIALAATINSLGVG